MADQITDAMVQDYRAKIQAGWEWLNKQNLAEGSVDLSKYDDVLSLVQVAANVLLTACEQRTIYEQLEKDIAAAMEASPTYDPFLPETMKYNAVYMVQYTTLRMNGVLHKLSTLIGK